MLQQQENANNFPRGIRRLILMGLACVLIALVAAASVKLYVDTGPWRWMPSRRWWDFALMTVIIFVMAAKLCRRYRGARSFWMALAGLLVVHLVFWTILLLNVAEWASSWFFVTMPVELAALVLALSKLGFPP